VLVGIYLVHRSREYSPTAELTASGN
jgi:hypothetical protein